MEVVTKYNIGDEVRYKDETWVVKTLVINIRKLSDSNVSPFVETTMYLRAMGRNDARVARVAESMVTPILTIEQVRESSVQRIPRANGDVFEVRHPAPLDIPGDRF